MFSENSNTNKIQHSVLEILKTVAAVCDENNLSYYLCGGSLLGAVRHQGFIPWDDDVDIMMPRDDYEKLIKIANEKLPSQYKLAHYSERLVNGKPIMHHVQVLDLDITLIRKWAKNSSPTNTWIDIFPLDGTPKGKIRRKLHYYHFLFWHFIMQLSWFEDMVNLSKPNRSIFEKMIIKFVQATHIGRSWDTVKIIDRIERIGKKYHFSNSDFVVSFYGSYRQREIIPRRWFDRKIRLPFEDTKFWVPWEFEEELTHYYDDYMTPPKTREEKEDHHKIQIEKKGTR